MTRMERFEESAAWLRERLGDLPRTAVVLGSGLGGLTAQLEDRVEIPYGQIPHFPLTRNENHKGVLAVGRLEGAPVILMSGRFHHYEGYSMEECAYHVPVFKLLGVETLVVTNAAGGINPTFQPGDLMLISDHIKLTSLTPVEGFADGELGPRFFDMGDAYCAALRETARQVAAREGVPLREGVYAYMAGPQYETPAEIRALSVLGADAVGMSTVPEAIMAAHCGIRLLGISAITNLAAGISPNPLSDEEVRQMAAQMSGRFGALVRGIVRAVS
mgnify:FL=1